MIVLALLKLVTGCLIGKTIGTYCAKNQLSPILGVALTVVTVLAACILIDKGFAQ